MFLKNLEITDLEARSHDSEQRGTGLQLVLPLEICFHKKLRLKFAHKNNLLTPNSLKASDQV